MLTCIPSKGTKCRIIKNLTAHEFDMGDIITVLDKSLWCKNNKTGEQWCCCLEDLELIESSPLVEMFSKLISH